MNQKPIIRPPNPKRREKANILCQIWNSRIPHHSSSPKNPASENYCYGPLLTRGSFWFFSARGGFFFRCSKLEIWESTISGRNASIFWDIPSVQLVNFCVHNRCLRLRPAVAFLLAEEGDRKYFWWEMLLLLLLESIPHIRCDMVSPTINGEKYPFLEGIELFSHSHI